MNGIILKKDERLLRIVRRSLLTHALEIIAIGACFGFGFFFMFQLFQLGWWGQASFAFLLGLGAILLLKFLFARYRTVTYMTTHRIVDIDRRGLFRCSVSDVPYDRIEDISGHVTGFLGTIFRYGDVHIHTGRGMARVVIDRVFAPVLLQQYINELRMAYGERRKHLEAEDVLRWINRASESELEDIRLAIEEKVNEEAVI